MQLTCQGGSCVHVHNKKPINQRDGNRRAAEVAAARAAWRGGKYVFHVQAARRLNGFMKQFNKMEIFRGVLFSYTPQWIC